MQIKLWSNFSKKSNSTKRPSDADAVVKDVRLKDNTSIESPTFLVSGNYTTDYNYAQAFGHYYFIDDIVQVTNGVYQISCSQDVLATWKDEILSHKFLVTRNSNEYIDTLNDSMIYTKTNVTQYKDNIDLLDTNGTYLLGVISSGNTLAVGTVKYYALTVSEMTAFMSNIFAPALWEQLVDRYGNPLDYIVSCVYVPFRLSGLEHTIILIGGIETGSSAGKLTQTVYTHSYDYTLRKHPNNESYLNMKPYSNYKIVSNAFGEISISNSDIINTDTLTISISCDVTGAGTLAIYNPVTNIPVVKAFSTLGVPIVLSRTMFATKQEQFRVVSSLVGLGGSIASGNLLGVANSSLNLASSIYDVEQGDLYRSGSSGCFIGTNTFIEFVTLFYDVSEIDVETCGKPLFKEKVLSTLSGYTVCSNASVSLPCLGNDRDTVNSMLNSGIFIE